MLVLLSLHPIASLQSQVSSAQSATDLAQRQVASYLAKLADLHCTETVTQEKLTGNGHVEASEHAKYDYLIMIDGNGDGLQLNESRIEASASHRKQLPMLVTNGFSTVLLIFHPYYRDSFIFDTGANDVIDGRVVVPIHFTHIAGRRSPAALALRGREYPLDLKGTAWLDRQSGDVVRMEASLLNDMSDIGLQSLVIHVDYKRAALGGTAANLTLPSVAVVEVSTPRQRWRNTHVFDAYKTFSTDAEQDSHVTIHAANATPDKDSTASAATSDTKEKP
jgi:hypothetical protein